MHKIILSFILSFALIICPIVKLNTVHAIGIPTFVVGLFLAVCISMGFYFNLHNVNIQSWAETVINAYLTSNGYSSIEAWLGANYESETTVSGSFLGLTPSLFAKLKLAVEFGISSGDLPSGGSETQPVQKTIQGAWYVPDFTYTDLRTNTTYSFNNYSVSHLDEICVNPGGTNLGGTKIIKYIPSQVMFTLPYSFMSTVSTPYRLVDFESNTVTGYSSFSFNGSDYNRLQTYIGSGYVTSRIMKPHQNVLPINTSSPIYCVPVACTVSGSDWLIVVFIYQSINGNFYLFTDTSSGYNRIPVVHRTSSSEVYSVGQPQYTFNNADLIYIDLQIGELTSALQALTALLTAINNNLVTWTIALQTNNPGDLPVDTTPFIDFVDYCNEQTNLYLSGTQSLAATVGNMYQELYNTLTGITSSQLSNACINTYNAFINKLTLFSSISDSGGSLYSVQAYQNDLTSLSGTFDQKISSATSLLDTYISNASGLQEIIGLYNAYTSYCDSLGFQINLVTDTKSCISQMNGIVDQFIAGTLSSDQALHSLLTLYKNGLTGANTADQLGAIVSAYQVCVDRVTLLGLEIDPNGLGDVSADVINLEDDLLSNIDLNEISSLLSFQNWTYINASEGSLYREFFQKIMDSDSPFYLYIYVPLILGIVSIILGTRVHLPSKKENDSGPHEVHSSDDSWNWEDTLR